MTTEQAIREAKNRWQRRRRRLIGYGQWQPFTDAAPVREHVQAIRATNMSVRNLAAATGVSVATLDHLLFGSNGYPPAAHIRTESARTLLAYWPTLDDYIDAAILDACGSRRRLQALAVRGIPTTRVAAHLGLPKPVVERAKRNSQVTARTARLIRDAYNDLSAKNGEQSGVTPWSARRCATQAQAKGWAPPAAWDDDTIDDPSAQPNWTGHCGTERGWNLHRIINQKPCDPCQNARDTFLDGIRHLPAADRARAMAAARAAAGSRCANLAHDARELLTQGYDRTSAAERLGITLDRLEAELKRNPDDGQVAA